jgi:hypothetical protein
VAARAAERAAAGLPPEEEEEAVVVENGEAALGPKSFEEPPFTFDFGFNPLVELGRLVRARHPRLRLKRAMYCARAFRLKRAPGPRAVTFLAPGPCSADATAAAASAASVALAATPGAEAEARAVAEAFAAHAALALTVGGDDDETSRMLDPRLGPDGVRHAEALRAEVGRRRALAFSS